MKRIIMILCQALPLSAFLMFPAMAADALFAISGVNATGAHVELKVDDAMIDSIGWTSLTTKVVSEGEAVRHVRGVKVDDILQHAGLVGPNLHVVALDGYAVDLPREDFSKYDAIFATEVDGRKLSVRDKGPAWIIYPVSDNNELDDPLYEARSVWQLKTVTVNNQ